jgi:hypothetical protein
MKERLVVTICCLKKSHFSLLVVLQNRYESIRLGVLNFFWFKYMGKSRKVTYLKNYAYSIDEIRQHEDREGRCGRLDRVCDDL